MIDSGAGLGALATVASGNSVELVKVLSNMIPNDSYSRKYQFLMQLDFLSAIAGRIFGTIDRGFPETIWMMLICGSLTARWLPLLHLDDNYDRLCTKSLHLMRHGG